MNKQHFHDAPALAGMHPELGLLLATLDLGTSDWQRHAGKLGVNAIRHQPRPDGHSIGGVLMHVAAVEVWWIHEVAGGRDFPPDLRRELMVEATDFDGGRWPKPGRQPLTWYYDRLAAIRKTSHEIVRHRGDPDEVLSHPETGPHSFTLRWILQHVILHEAYHYGQAMVLADLYRNRPRPARA